MRLTKLLELKKQLKRKRRSSMPGYTKGYGKPMKPKKKKGKKKKGR